MGEQVEGQAAQIARSECPKMGIVLLCWHSHLSSDLAAERDHFQDYVIVHELLHLRVPNHGRLFEALMTAYVPGLRLLEESHQTAPARRKTLRAGREKS